MSVSRPNRLWSSPYIAEGTSNAPTYNKLPIASHPNSKCSKILLPKLDIRQESSPAGLCIILVQL